MQNLCLLQKKKISTSSTCSLSTFDAFHTWGIVKMLFTFAQYALSIDLIPHWHCRADKHMWELSYSRTHSMIKWKMSNRKALKLARIGSFVCLCEHTHTHCTLYTDCTQTSILFIFINVFVYTYMFLFHIYILYMHICDEWMTQLKENKNRKQQRPCIRNDICIRKYQHNHTLTTYRIGCYFVAHFE